MEDDNTVIAGSRIIFDLNGVKLGHYLQMTLTTMKKMVTLAQVKFKKNLSIKIK